ncbi:5-oxoprolinase subunit PxpB [Ekhidna sp.]|uniref:5-oxoprolinase subunit PxpB n=1 Tax=Ekhidna sp. TaxID=2608089 RepID=UPI003B4FFB2C
MSIKESKSLQFNSISWRVSLLGEQVVLLECTSEIEISKIHNSVKTIQELFGSELKDVVPSYNSIAVFSELSLDDIIDELSGKVASAKEEKEKSEIIELPICYELGMDLDRISEKTGLSVEAVMDKHLKGIYRSILIGFTPGFIYADGLDPSLACPRLENPRKHLPSGSIGIGGVQTGIYSLSSPGGWNILGRTPASIFDADREPPMLIDVGMNYKFYRISKSEFESWEN